MTPAEEASLREVGSRFRDTLTAYFEAERDQGQIILPDGPDSALIGRVRQHDEAHLIGVELTEQPTLGIIVSVSHWSIPPGAVLDVFVPAYGTRGVLTDHFIIPQLPVVDFRERLESRGFASSWVAHPGRHLHVSLYDETFPA